MPNAPETPIHLEGQLLIADPSLRDGVFNKTVIYLAEHSIEDGAFGLIINHPTQQFVGEVLTDTPFQPLASIPIYVGGPIDPEHISFAAFSRGKGEQLQLTTRLSVTEAVRCSQQPGTLIKAYAGYAGWTSGQLESELRQNIWITTQAHSRLLADEHQKGLWQTLLREISPYHKILAESPDDIFLN